MENLALHIEYLLLRHDCVVVPGIGAFINIYEAPVFNPETGMISPMRREVRFNSALRADDGMLANSYARKLGITYREGSERMSRAVTMLAETLRLDGEITVGRLGTISREEEGNLIFRPFRTADQRSEDMGFISVNFRSRYCNNTDKNSEISPSENADNLCSDKSEFGNTQTIDSDNRINRMDFDRNWYIPVNKTFAKFCACLLIVMAIGLISFNPVSDTKRIEDKASVIPIDKIIDTAVHTTRTLTESTPNPEKSAEIAAEENSGDPAEIANSLPYHLIVATFASCNEAERYAESNKGRGYELEVIPSRKLCRVSAKSSANRESLIDELNSATFKNTFSEGWIWEE